MSTHPTHSPLPPPAPAAPAPTPAGPDNPVLRCRKCKIPLPDATWKNCAPCRRKRTESYNRWKKSSSLRQSMGTANLSESVLCLPHHSSSLFWAADPSTSSQAPGPATPLGRHSNGRSHSGDVSESSQFANDQPRQASTSSVPPPTEAIEYQWSDELIEDLLELPPRSVFNGKFSIVADPAVNNSTRAHLFAGQLHAKAVPISCDIPFLIPFLPHFHKRAHFLSVWHRDYSQMTSLNTGSRNSSSFVSYCTCQEGCQGRFVVSVDDDRSHPYGVPGQRIGVVVVHSSLPD